MWYAANAEEQRARKRMWYAANAEQQRARKRMWYAANAEQQRARKRMWYAANAEEQRARKRKRWAEDPAYREKHRERNLKRYYDKKRGEMFLGFLKVAKVLREMAGT
jgi:hypothetical protein